MIILNNNKFTQKYYGKVFTIFSVKQGDKKVIANVDVIDEIKQEIYRLMKLNRD